MLIISRTHYTNQRELFVEFIGPTTITSELTVNRTTDNFNSWTGTWDMIGSSLGNKQTNTVRPAVKITEVNHLIYGRLNLKPVVCGAVYKEQISSKTNKKKIKTTTIKTHNLLTIQPCTRLASQWIFTKRGQVKLETTKVKSSPCIINPAP